MNEQPMTTDDQPEDDEPTDDLVLAEARHLIELGEAARLRRIADRQASSQRAEPTGIPTERAVNTANR